MLVELLLPTVSGRPNVSRLCGDPLLGNSHWLIGDGARLCDQVLLLLVLDLLVKLRQANFDLLRSKCRCMLLLPGRAQSMRLITACHIGCLLWAF